MIPDISRRLKSLWQSMWPLWALLVFESLGAIRLLPEGYTRAAVAAPIVLLVPGSLTLGAIFAQRRRLEATEFVCYAALLSAIWLGFASLILYICGVRITFDSTYLCLLIASIFLTIVAEARFLFEHQGRRSDRNAESPDPEMSAAETAAANAPAAIGTAGSYAVAAAVAGVSLLAGGLYTYDHLRQPAPTGYTSMAWTGRPITGVLSIGSTGKTLHFQIVHHEPETTSFRLSAIWLTNPLRPLAKTLNFSIGPDQKFQGALLVPPLPDGCIYRIGVALTATRQLDPLTNNLQTWSINVEVHDPAKSKKRCQ